MKNAFWNGPEPMTSHFEDKRTVMKYDEHEPCSALNYGKFIRSILNKDQPC